MSIISLTVFFACADDPQDTLDALVERLKCNEGMGQVTGLLDGLFDPRIVPIIVTREIEFTDMLRARAPAADEIISLHAAYRETPDADA
jgi:hypothetical protein